jgi:hypothetical protein
MSYVFFLADSIDDLYVPLKQPIETVQSAPNKTRFEKTFVGPGDEYPATSSVKQASKRN